eukprot:COSAG02_NODE_22275_length_757_cov_11.920973_1_plen_69_part_00
MTGKNEWENSTNVDQPAGLVSIVNHTLIDCSDDHLSVPVARRSGAPSATTTNRSVPVARVARQQTPFH